MFTPSRDDARRLFFEVWRKFGAGEPLGGLERTVIEVLSQHPEYRSILDDPDRFLQLDYLPENGATNPFLHLSLHLAVEEQLAIDQPAGIRAAFSALAARLGSEHDAKHVLLECLGETIWRAQRDRQRLDERLYLDCLTRKTPG
ncbi:MAG: DUF1841 family protein [Betaproteobacteria bacterium]